MIGEFFMPIHSSASADGRELRIHVDGRFDFGAHRDFRSCYEKTADAPQRYIVDLSTATYLDSSALGMLLLLRDHGGGETAQVEIVNCNEEVRRVLRISNFDKLFSIT